MKNKFLILLFCFGFISISRANDPNFGILPENLKQDANAIIRYYDVDVTMISKNIFTKTVKYAITILTWIFIGLLEIENCPNGIGYRNLPAKMFICGFQPSKKDFYF